MTNTPNKNVGLSDIVPGFDNDLFNQGRQSRIASLQQAAREAGQEKSGNPEQGFFGDTVDAMQSGAANSLAGMSETVHQITGSETAGDIGRSMSSLAGDQFNQMSPSGQQAMQKRFFEEDATGAISFGDAWSDPRAIALQATTLAGQMVPQILSGFGIGALGAKTVGKVVFKNVYKSAVKKGMSAKAAGKHATNVTRTVFGTGGQAIADTAAAGGMIGIETRDEVLSMTDDQLDESNAFRETYYQLHSEMPELGVDELRNLATQSLADRAAAAVQSDPKLIASNLVLGAAGGFYIDRLLRGVGTGSRLSNAGVQTLAQGSTEAGQAGMETYAQNTTLIDERIDEDRDASKNVLANALNEGTLAGIVGGVGGAIAKGKPVENSASDTAELSPVEAQEYSENGEQAMQPVEPGPMDDLGPAESESYVDPEPAMTLEEAVEKVKAERGQYRGIDDDIAIAERMGFDDEAVRLRAAKRNFEMAADFVNEGDTESAKRFNERALKIYREVTQMGVPELQPKQRNTLPAEYVAVGEFMQRPAELPRGKVGETFDEMETLVPDVEEFQPTDPLLPAPDAIDAPYYTDQTDVPDVEYETGPQETEAVQLGAEQPPLPEVEETDLAPVPEVEEIDAVPYEKPGLPTPASGLELADYRGDEAIDFSSGTNTNADELAGRVTDEIRKHKLPAGLNDGRLLRENFRNKLLDMRDSLVAGGGITYVRDNNDRIIGRTPSINPDWFQNAPDNVRRIGVKNIQVSIDRALKGKSLGKGQARAVKYLLDYFTDERNEYANQHMKPDRENVIKFRKVIRGELTPMEAGFVEELSPVAQAVGAQRTSLSEIVDDDILAESFDAADLDASGMALAEVIYEAKQEKIPDAVIVKAAQTFGDDPITFGVVIEELVERARNGNEVTPASIEGFTTGGALEEESTKASESAAEQQSGAEAQLLTSYTERDIAEREQARAEQEKSEKAQQQAEANKARADSEALDFVLSGSDLPADVAASRGQSSLFGAGGEPSTQKNESKQTPANAGVSRSGPDVIRNSAGKPFKRRDAARITLKKNPGYEITKVDGGYELRPEPEGAATAPNGNMANPPRTGALDMNDDLSADVNDDFPASVEPEQSAKVRQMTASGRAADGKPIMPGDVFQTATGRTTTPYPKQKSAKYSSQWLIDNATAEARARGNGLAARNFENAQLLKGGELTASDLDSMNQYLFDPESIAADGPSGRSILKPLNPADTKGSRSNPPKSENKIFTEDAAEKAREILKKKLGQMSSGIDPEILQAGITLAGYHIEKGARTFAAFARAMTDDLGDMVKPYLKSWYMGVKYDPRAAGFDGMNDAATVDASDIDAILNAPDTLETEANSQEVGNGTIASGMDQRDQDGASASGGRRGRAAQPGYSRSDTQDLAGAEPENVEPTTGGGSDGGTGVRAAGEDVANGGRTGSSRVSANGRQGASGSRAPDAGTGDRPAAEGSRQNGGDAAPKPGVKDPASTSPAYTGPGNYHIDNPLEIVGGGQVARFNKNKQAIELFNDIRDNGRTATREEQDVLAGYTGWGSFGQELFQGTWNNPKPKTGWEARDAWLRDQLGQDEWESMQRSITNSHYTDPPTVMAMWDMVKRMGFEGGRVLEPSMGIGNFYGMMPMELKNRSQISGIELDMMTGSMAQMLYPDANIKVMGYQESKTPDDFYDVVIGNWPFENTAIADRRYNKFNPMLHDYFFLKTIDQVRPGGIVIGITSKGSMDKKDSKIRSELAKKAELVASFRLPSGAFEEYAGTKVVTDIIILKKRAEPLGMSSNEGWIKSVPYMTPQGMEVFVNEYYASHPDHVIGNIEYGHGTTFNRPGMIVTRPDNMAEQLQRIVSMVPQGVFESRRVDNDVTYITNHTADREGSLTLQNGKLYVVRGEHLAPAEQVLKYAVKSQKTTSEREQQLRDLIGIRQAYAQLIEAENGLTGNDPEPLRKALRKQYNAFTKANGPLNESWGLQYLKRIDDPFRPALAALESERNGKTVPAAILERSTIRTPKTIDSPTVREAFVLARNESVNPTLDKISQLSGKPADKVKAELIESGAVFELPSGDIAPSDIYLSGNVREKMRQAVAALEQGNTAMQRNIDELQKVMPKDVPYFNIEAQLGASWVPTAVYEEYVAHMLDANSTNDIRVTYAGGKWKVDLAKNLYMNTAGSTGFGTHRYNFKKLVNAAFGNQTVTIKAKDIDGNEFVDEEGSAEVNGKISDMRAKFKEWLWQDPDRRLKVEREYNEVRNAYATPRFDGSFLRFDGMTLTLGTGPFNLRQHQADAIWRALVTRRSLNAHEVGTGKTFTMGGIAVESRRYGIAKKPLILAHNANSASVAHEIEMMYPAAKVLYIDNLDPKSIERKMRQIANDDWDAVVLPHSQLSKLALREDTLMAMAQEDIAELERQAIEAAEEDGGDLNAAMMDALLDGDKTALKKVRSPTAKELVKMRNRVIETIRKQGQKASKANAISFEELGIDMLLVDEAHVFKKPPFATRMKMKGLNTQSSDASIALNFLARYIRANNNGGNIHLFTGTPVTNTLTEVFHMMRYIMNEEMQQQDLDQWDGWFNSFASEVMDIELNGAGEYEPVTRLAGFINVPELRKMIGQYMDTVFADDMPEMQPRKTANGKTLSSPDLTELERADLLNGRTEGAKDRPYKKVVNESSDLSAEQLRVFNDVKRNAQAFRNMSPLDRRRVMQSGGPESPLLYEQMANKASFDVRLVRGEELAGQEGKVPDHPESKASRAIRNMMEIYSSDSRATQVVFSEMGISKKGSRSVGEPGEKKTVTFPVFSTIHDMIERLVQAGVPREQIALVDGSTSKEKRKEIAEKMNRSEIRIVFGSTASLGVGVNMQRNLRAMHHLDAPWMPGDLEQRNGRGHRQGNQWNTVLEYRYLTDRIDGRRWQVLSVKQRFINAFLKASDDSRIIEGDAASDDGSDILESFSEAAGDPRILIRKKMESKLEQMRQRRRLHDQGMIDAKNRVSGQREKLRRNQGEAQRIDESGAIQRAQQIIERNAGANFSMKFGDQTVTDRKAAQDLIEEFVAENVRIGGAPKTIAEFDGIPVQVVLKQNDSQPRLLMDINGIEVASNSRKVITLENALRALPKSYNDLVAENTETEQNIQRLVQVSKEPFSQENELKRMEQDLAELEQDIQDNPVAPPVWLRNGTPVESEVQWKGRVFEVTGHRWNDAGWFVLAKDSKGSAVIPYMEVTDNQGMPLYEEQEFQSPDIVSNEQDQAEDAQFSRSAASVTGTPLSEADLDAVFNRVAPRLKNGNGYRIFDNVRDLFAAHPEIEQAARKQGSSGSDIEGVFHRGEILIVRNKITSEAQAEALMFHEATHGGVNAMMADEGVTKAANRLFVAMGGERGFVQHMERLGLQDKLKPYIKGSMEKDKDGNPVMTQKERQAMLVHELLAFTGEKNSKGIKQKARELIGAIRQWLRKHGYLASSELSTSEISHMARQARKYALGGKAGNTKAPRFVSAGNTMLSRNQDGAAVTDTEAFKRWFGDSKVVDSDGKPLVVYHGSPDLRFIQEDGTFKSERERYGFGRDTGAHWFAASKDTAKTYADPRRAFDYQRAEEGLVAAYLKIENPLVIEAGGAKWREAQRRGKTGDVIRDAMEGGHDGIIIKGVRDNYQTGVVKGDRPTDTYVVFNSNQIKSATENNGNFDGSNPNILFRLSDALANDASLTDDQKAALSKIGPKSATETAADRFREVADRWRTKVRQGMADRFASLLDLDKQLLNGNVTSEENITKSSWVKARMSNAAGGAVSAMMNSGRIYLDSDQGVVDVKEGTSGLVYTLNKLGSAAEVERFMGWIAGNRGEKLMAEGRENLFTPSDIDALKTLNTGNTADGRDRSQLYSQVFKEFQQHRDDVLAIAEKAGIITSDNREMWANEFYVPFYRLDEDADDVTGPRVAGGLSRQQAYKKLKGGTQNLNDLLQNTIMNFHHLMDASLKNMAATQAIDNALQLDVVEQTTESARDKKQSTFVLRNGEKVWYDIADPLVYQALTSLNSTGMNSTAMKVMRAFKRTFTSLTTSTPQFIIANLIRDSLSAISVTDMKYNAAGNVASGLKSFGILDRNGYERARLMASGGAFSFGHAYGEDAESIRFQIDGQLRRGKILSNPKALLKFGLKPLQAGWDRWQDINNSFENANRMAAFKQAEEAGKGKLYAAFQARDLMDFSAHGAWPAVRFLIDTVPFLNARLQGLDKLYRSGVKPTTKVAMQMLGVGSIETSVSERKAAARFSAVVGSLAVATMALYLHNRDDDDYEKAEDWLKDTYWWVRIPGTEHVGLIPKPFEVGAIATLAERLLEQAVDDKATGELFRERLGHMLSNTFSFSVVPQLFQPAIDVYSNRDSFTGRDIETMGQQRLSPVNRTNSRTTGAAELISKGLESVAGSDSMLSLSPIQIDYLIGGYFGQVGSWAVAQTDIIKNVLSDVPKPERNWYEYQPIRRFYRNMGDPSPNKQTTLFYESLRESSRLQADLRQYRTEGDQEAVSELMQESGAVANLNRRLNRMSRKLTALNARIKDIQAKKTMSPEEKRRAIDVLKLRKQQLIEVVIPAIEEAIEKSRR